MGRSKPADFFLTGLVVVFPVLLWSENYELAMLVFGVLLMLLGVCGLMAPGED
jgi:hypothetical protein